MKAKNILFGLVFLLIICIATILIWKYSDENQYTRELCEFEGGEFSDNCQSLGNEITMSFGPCCRFEDGTICYPFQLFSRSCK